jgi:hypothetical protein
VDGAIAARSGWVDEKSAFQHILAPAEFVEVGGELLDDANVSFLSSWSEPGELEVLVQAPSKRIGHQRAPSSGDDSRLGRQLLFVRFVRFVRSP